MRLRILFLLFPAMIWAQISLNLPNEKAQRSDYPIPKPPKEIPLKVALPDLGEDQNLKLAFEDQFNGTTIDQEKWTMRGD